MEGRRKVDLKRYVRETEREREKENCRFYHRSKVHISVRRIANRKIRPFLSPFYLSTLRVRQREESSSTSTRISLLFHRKLLDLLFSRPRAPPPPLPNSHDSAEPTLAFKWGGEGARFRNCTRGRWIRVAGGFYATSRYVRTRSNVEAQAACSGGRRGE